MEISHHCHRLHTFTVVPIRSVFLSSSTNVADRTDAPLFYLTPLLGRPRRPLPPACELLRQAAHVRPPASAPWPASRCSFQSGNHSNLVIPWLRLSPPLLPWRSLAPPRLTVAHPATLRRARPSRVMHDRHPCPSRSTGACGRHGTCNRWPCLGVVRTGRIRSSHGQRRLFRGSTQRVGRSAR